MLFFTAELVNIETVVKTELCVELFYLCPKIQPHIPLSSTSEQ